MVRLASILILLGVGCGPTVPSTPHEESSTTSEPESEGSLPPFPGTSTGTPPGTTAASTASTDTGNDSGSSDEGLVFLHVPDGGFGPCLCCDVFAQDCPDGEKCSAWGNDGGDDWNGTRCSPVARDAGSPGEPCTMQDSPASGFDDCAQGSMCWDVDPATLAGTCVALCTGDEGHPQCPASTDCLIANNGVLNLCLPTCDPLISDCEADQACLPSAHAFVCVSTHAGEGAGAGEACDEIYDCQPGLLCRTSTSVGPPCDEGELRCCTPFCELTAPDPTAPCLDPGQVCSSWWGQETPPAGLEGVGMCVLPT